MLFRLVAPVISFFALVLTGCESGDESSASAETRPNEPIDAPGNRVAVLPSADLSYLPSEYDHLYAQVDAQLMQWLKDNGKMVAPAALVSSVLASNPRILQQLKASQPAEQESGVVDLLWKVRDTENVDFLIIPQVLTRSRVIDAPYDSVAFDGVSRPFVIHGGAPGKQPVQVELGALTTGVYNQYGQAVYFGTGGIDVLDNGVRAGEGIYTAPKRPEQVNAQSVGEAIQVALGPWLSESMPARAPPTR